MPSVIIRPDATVSAGDWSIQDELIAGVLGDQNVDTEVVNTSEDQEIKMTLSDVSDDLGAQQFTSATINVSAKRTARGDGTFKALLTNEEGVSLHSDSFTVQDTIYTNFTTNVNINLSNDEVNSLRLSIITTTGTQVIFNEAFVTVVYGVVGSNGEIILSSGLIQLTSGKVTL